MQRIVIRGRRREMGLGGFPLVSLAEAREKAFANRKLAREGGDPLTHRFRAQGMPTFAQAAERVWNEKSPGWRHSGHAQNWMSSLTRHVLPHIGDQAVCDVDSADLLFVLRRIWHSRPETARRVRQRISAVMEWAIAMHLRDDDPCDRLGAGATLAVKLAFEFLVLTAARSGEVRGAKWSEIEVAARLWTIPATRMKSRRHHRVPLCQRAMAILEAARQLGGGCSTLVFPSQGDKPISITRLPKILQSVKVDAVPHGFRSSFRDWAAEETDHPREVVEAALAHAVGNQTEAAYARSDLFERRRRLMDEWADYLGQQRSAARLPLVSQHEV